MVPTGTSSLSYDYDPDFYEEVTESAVKSARVVVPYLVNMIQPLTVIDIGCGAGAWTREFQQHNCFAWGVDGEWARPHLLFDDAYFIPADLSYELYIMQLDTCDMVLCLEVAEHLPKRRAKSLVEDLCSLSNTVVFGAAVPGQGGHGHINEQPHEYWIDLFDALGYEADNCMQAVLPFFADVAWWYQQNIFIFRSK